MKPLHRHLVNTSRKVLCTAALAASLTTAAVVTSPSTADAGESEPTPDSPQAADRGDARLDLPDIIADPPPTGVGAPEGASGIPATALDAYHRAELSVAAALPGCKLPWQLLAGIGRVESVHASGYGLKADGYTEKAIRGPRLDGNGFAEIRDTDKGEWDADAVYDRAVGPMQFIPSTWATWGADGNGDSKRDPNNIYDAALGAGLYLCAGDRDLSNAAKLDEAILSYNNSREYVNTVLGYMRQYQAGGAGEVPNPPVGDYPTQPPGTLPTPRVPVTPSNPVTPTPTPTPTPKPTPTPTPTPEQPKPTPTPEQPKPATPRLAELTVLGGPGLTAEAGAAFAEVPRVKVLLSDGKPAVNQEVVFAVEGDTTGGTLFGTADSLVVKAGADGIAAAPGLKAGPKAGTFTLRASAYDPQGRITVKFEGKVTVTVADKLARAGDAKPLEAVAGKSFTGVEVFATAGGKAVAGTEAVADLVVKDADGKWVPVDPKTAKGPFFKDETGKPVFGRLLPKAGADGKIVLPELFTTDAAPGTYFVRLTTKENVTLVLELKVTAPATTPAPTQTPDPTPDPVPVPAKGPARP
ncbi:MULTISPECIES: lytic transglycosylase domain-containing protein [unclassified Streptomyces]|uniref:lytic transglycosylase domain-containing protein n=1 Tax=unclassified Streptomyces TaxID=2593676 RepID=UPI002E2DECAC|nr:lytic transglycosylase domain-containing protein [Streptomyces sp. NBC_01439]